MKYLKMLLAVLKSQFGISGENTGHDPIQNYLQSNQMSPPSNCQRLIEQIKL